MAIEPGACLIELFPAEDEGVVGEEVGMDGGEMGESIPDELPPGLPNDDCGIGYGPEEDDVLGAPIKDPTGDDRLIMDDARECPLPYSEPLLP